MKLSARNQLAGTVKAIKEDSIMAEVTVTLDGGTDIVSVITTDSVHRLALKSGMRVTVMIKSTEVMLATED
jgi:molybdate transport system regulatory protein